MESLINGYCRFLGQATENKAAVISYTVAVLVVLLVAILPLHNYYQAHKQDFIQQSELAIWLQSQHQQLDRAATYAKQEQAGILQDEADNRTLVVLLSETAGEAELLLARLEHRRPLVIVSIENQSFSDVFNWLRSLTDEYDVIVDQANMTYVAEDKVNARLAFKQN